MWKLNRPLARLALPVALVLAVPALRAVAQNDPVQINLKLEPFAVQQARIDSPFVSISLTAQKPAGVLKEPMYAGTPQYAVMHLGNGPRSTYFLALDEPKDGPCKLYIDRNHNGDLTAATDCAPMTKTKIGDHDGYAIDATQLEASWGNADDETASSYYGVSIRRDPTENSLQMRVLAARVGIMNLNGGRHKVLLVENDVNALYAKPVAVDEMGKPLQKPTTRPVWLLADLSDKGDFHSLQDTPQQIDIRGPFQLAGGRYEATVTPDGSHITLNPTTKAIADLIDPEVRAQMQAREQARQAALARARAEQAALAPQAPNHAGLLTAGEVAPNFTADAWGGGGVRLSDFRGKVVILDFWATWCPPCRASMPHLEKVHRAIQGQDAVVLAVCVTDTRGAFEQFVPQHKNDYTFRFAYDPAGRDADRSISAHYFNVQGIPTTYIIDREGKVAATVVGYGQDDHRIEQELKKLGINANTESASR